MASIDHLYQESLTLRVKDHSDKIYVQYLVNCLEEDHVCHGITIQEPRPRPMKELSTPDITQLFFLELAQTGWKATRICTHMRRFGYSTPRKQQSSEEASTPNIGRGAETQPKTTMHSLITTVRTLSSIAGLQA